jgi:hypothetical protein
VKRKKPTELIRAKAPARRSPTARVINQKAQTMAEGPRRQSTRQAQKRAALEDQGAQ